MAESSPRWAASAPLTNNATTAMAESAAPLGGRRVPIAWEPSPPPPSPPSIGGTAPDPVARLSSAAPPLAGSPAVLPQPQRDPIAASSDSSGAAPVYAAAPLLERLLLPDPGDAVAMLAGTAIGAALTRTLWGVLRLRAVRERHPRPSGRGLAMPARRTAADFPASSSRRAQGGADPTSDCSTPRTAIDWSAAQSPTSTDVRPALEHRNRSEHTMATVRRGGPRARGGARDRCADTTPSPVSTCPRAPPPAAVAGPDVTVCRLAHAETPRATAVAGPTAAAFTRVEQTTAAAFTREPPAAVRAPAGVAAATNTFDSDNGDDHDDGPCDDIATEAPLRNAPGSEWMMVK